MALSLADRIEAVERAYEFMLAYAGQGKDDAGDPAASEIRATLTALASALDGIAEAGRAAADGRANAQQIRDFLVVISADAGRSLSAVRLALSTKAITSALVDNLNGSIHLRALLTDLFVLDEAMKLG